MTSTLTDRYVVTLTRLLPARQRKDIERELRASIADAVDERLTGGEPQHNAERDVLADLGDPVLLAAQYTDRPTALIGPRYYGDYRRIMAVLATVAPGVAVVVVVGQVLYAVPLGVALLTGLAAGLAVAVIAAFWLTLIFAILERLPRRRGDWQPSSLRPTDDTVGGTIGGLAFVLAIGALLVLSPQFTSVVDATGTPITILAPGLWPDWAPVIVGILVLAVVFGIVTEYFGWSIPLAITNTIVVLAGFGLFLWWATHDLLLNPAFFEAIGWDPAVPGTITVLALVLMGLNDIVEIVGGFVKARRAAVTA